MKEAGHETGRFLGYVQLVVGSKLVALPVQAVPLRRPDGTVTPSGLVREGTQFGIVVDSEASPSDVQAQIKRASLDAVKELSQKYLN
jgi:hypothetical protein